MTSSNLSGAGLAAALLFALCVACGLDGPPPNDSCSALSCGGCCRADGRCMPGSAVAACGTAGAACADCSSVGACNEGLCAPHGDGGMDGGSCPAADLVLVNHAASAAGDTSAAEGSRIGTCGGNDAADQAFGFTLGAKARVLIDVVPTSSDLRPVVYLRTRCVTAPKEVAQGCIAADSAGAAATLLLDLDPGDYELVVDGAPQSAGAFTVSIRSDVDGDNCTSPVPLALGGGAANVSTRLSMFTHDTSGSCAGESAPDAVFSFTTTETMDLSAVAATSSDAYDPALYLRRSCGADQVQCGAAFLGPSTTLAAFALPPGTWYLWVDSRRGQGPVRLSLQLSTPPAGDHCSGPEPLVFSGGQAGGEASTTVTFARAHNHEQHSCLGTQPDWIYAFSTDRTLDLTVRVIAPGFSNTHALALRAGGCGSALLTCVAPSATTQDTVLRAGALPSGDWQLIVESSSGVELSALLTPPVKGDRCADPAELTLSPSGTALVATASGDTSTLFDNAQGTCGGSAADAVYRLQVPAAATLTAAATAGGSLQPVLYLRQGDCSSGTELGCAEAAAAGGQATVGPVAVSAGTWFLWVDGIAGTTGSYTLDVTLE
jgi:hypothetical protein